MTTRRQRRSQKKRRKQQGTIQTADGQRIIRGPKTRLADLFKVLKEVAATGDRAEVGAIQSPGAHRLDVAFLERAVNAIKAVRLLLQDAHWEHASGSVRMMFELLVNLEHIAAQPDRDAAALRYGKFGLLQMADKQLRFLNYNRKTSRPVDEGRVQKLEKFVELNYEDFLTLKGKRMKSWSGKSVRELTRLSPSPLREAQYENLFRPWSEQIHAAPRALVDRMLDQGGDKAWVARMLANDDREVLELGNLAVVLFVEIWDELPSIQPIPKAKALRWIQRIFELGRKSGAYPAEFDLSRPPDSDG